MNQLYFVTIKKHGLTMPELWIAGVFEAERDATLFLASLDEELSTAASISNHTLDYPFYIIEHFTEKFEFAQSVSEALTLIDRARGGQFDPIVYVVHKPWRFEKGQDQMGTLEHFHIEEDMDDASIQGRFQQSAVTE